MNQSDKHEKIAKRVIFMATFALHFGWIFCAHVNPTNSVIENSLRYLSDFYSALSITWKGDGAYIVTVAIISSITLNIIRRACEGYYLGWPRFKSHDKYSFSSAIISLMVYGTLVVFAVGYFGQKFSARPMDPVNLGIISVSMYIAGTLINFVDEAASSILVSIGVIEK